MRVKMKMRMRTQQRQNGKLSLFHLVPIAVALFFLSAAIASAAPIATSAPPSNVLVSQSGDLECPKANDPAKFGSSQKLTCSFE